MFYLQRLKTKKRALERNQFKNENEVLNKDLLLVNQELTSKMMYMIKLSKLIEDVTERLLRLKYNLKKESDNHKKVVIFISIITLWVTFLSVLLPFIFKFI